VCVRASRAGRWLSRHCSAAQFLITLAGASEMTAESGGIQGSDSPREEVVVEKVKPCVK
jgi:hypothetical protein